MGRGTWQLFSRIWPGRSDEFSARMNAAPKRVASRTLTDVSAWDNSSLIQGELTEAVRGEGDLVVIGSTSVVRTLMEHYVVDEYRLLVFPVVLSRGGRLFDRPLADLRLVSVEQAGAAALLCYARSS